MMFKKPLKVSGFSLLELIITVTIAGILTVIAVPTFSSVISNNRLTAYTNQFVTTLNFARNEAIRRGTQIKVKRQGNTTKQWQTGWNVCLDDTCANTTLLKTYSALPTTLTLSSNTKIADAISFNAIGRSSTPGTLILCDSSRVGDDKLKSAKILILDNTGRVRLGVDTDNDGFPQLSDGSAIENCTPP